MSLLHSFYCWGSVGVILLSTAFFAVFGIEKWRVLACIWAIIPLYNVYNFSVCPIERLTDEGKGLSVRKLCTIPVFWVSLLLMVCAGASELSMAQWASAYAESALGLSKSLGDIVGPCDNLKAGMLAGCIFPAVLVVSTVLLRILGEKKL